jgi:hypothetical protein
MGIAVAWAPSPELLEDDELPPEPLPVEEALALTVVLPTVVAKVEEPEVTVLTTAAVETAVEFPPEPPAPPAAP